MITETKVRTRQLEASHAGASRYQESDQAILERDQKENRVKPDTKQTGAKQAWS